MRNFLYIFGILFLNTSYGQEEQTLPEAIAKDTLQSVAVKDSLPQETTLTALERGREFVIGGIEVKGAKHYNAQTIIVASGLKVGDKITIPSERFTRIIHKLWNYQVFNDIDIYIAKTEGNKVFLEFVIQEMPELTEVKIEGIRKRKGEELLKKIELDKDKLKKTTKKINESLIAKTKSYITDKYRKEGFLNTKVHITTQPVDSLGTKERMLIRIDRGYKVKINHITFEGNEKFADSKLRRQMKKTKQRFFGRFWKRSKYVQDKYNEDLASLIDFYKENGYRDARVTRDTLYDGKENIDLKISLEEGRKYYFGDIKFLGNTIYSNQMLSHILGLKKGEVYNGVQLRNRINDPKDPDANSISNLYQNTGYLFSQINPVETSVVNDTINFEVRIHEGKQAHFNNITVTGNSITNDRVIYRELRTRPGYLYSKEDVIRTVRELSQMGIFDAQSINPQIKNPDPNSGTVDLEYGLTDNGSSSQIQLQGGYGGGGFMGTLGLNFNNFSIQNIFDKKSYRPLPMGDAQKLALNVSVGRAYRVGSFSFMEPWWGGER
ncbi:MAG: outer membrane protein assembly factor, partial [Capnocytophaga granulosa]